MSGPWATCDRCGFRRRHAECRKEWTGAFVCAATCYDPRPPQLDPPYVNPHEGGPIPNARLDATNYTFISDDHPVSGDDL